MCESTAEKENEERRFHRRDALLRSTKIATERRKECKLVVGPAQWSPGTRTSCSFGDFVVCRPFFLECEDSRRYEATLFLGEKFLLFAPTGSELAREINRGRNRREEEERLKFHRDRVMRAPIK